MIAGCGVDGSAVETAWAMSCGAVGETEGEFSCHGWQMWELANASEETVEM